MAQRYGHLAVTARRYNPVLAAAVERLAATLDGLAGLIEGPGEPT